MLEFLHKQALCLGMLVPKNSTDDTNIAHRELSKSKVRASLVRKQEYMGLKISILINILKLKCMSDTEKQCERKGMC